MWSDYRSRIVYKWSSKMPKVAVITGANAGIGQALAARLLENDPTLTLCLACRSNAKAETARQELLQRFPSSVIDLVTCDVSSIASVTQCCNAIKRKYTHVDYLYLNAGVMKVSGVDWARLFTAAFSASDLAAALTTGQGLLRQQDGGLTVDGLQQTFATNVFGHFVMIRQLVSVMGGSMPTRIIWTSSSNASKQAFTLQDIQHSGGDQPYSSSKYAVDLLSNEINTRYNSQGIYSHTTCPGLVMSNITHGILPAWFWTLILPLLVLLRLLAPSLTISPYNGAEVLIWPCGQKGEGLDPMAKFYSRISVTGKRYVIQQQMDIQPQCAGKLFDALDALERKLTSKS